MAARSPFSRVLAMVCAATVGAIGAPDAGQMSRGERIYAEKCLMCHQPTGLGVPPAFPPLAGSEWVSGDRTQLIKVLCEGLAGTIVVKGQTYSNAMPAQ